ncbi:sensorin-A-like [Babylonia areolata]|uniref:sensorin-A-like n=1 Tax=Babylonia areolata TaxID=304850 RepID=UPI003FD31CD4
MMMMMATTTTTTTNTATTTTTPRLLPRSALLVLMLLLLHVTLARPLSLSHLPQPGEEGADGGMGEALKRDGRRITRGRYRMGYMFGKRSGLEDSTASLLIKSLIGKAMSVEDLARGLQSDSSLAQRVARHLDTNGDGYVSVSELL